MGWEKSCLDELDLEIRRNFERRGWLPLMDIDNPPPATLIKEFYSNLSIHSNDSNTQFVKSWRRGEECVITPSVVASTLGVPKVQHPVYPYDESPPLDDIMSYLTGTSIRWGTDPWITSHELTEIHYFFSGFLAIPSGSSLTCTLFLSRDVHFCMPLSQMLL